MSANSTPRRMMRHKAHPVGGMERHSVKEESLFKIQCVGNYDLGRTLGSGQFGKVKLAKHVLTGELVAIKIISKMKLDSNALMMVKREISILKKLQHPNIIRLYEVIETEKFLFLITEYASGGEILDYVAMHKKLTEEDARRFFRQLICALNHCHKLGIVHRDLKAENILLDENLNIKIIDFGFSNLYQPNQLLKTPCGSPTYAAPELLLQKQYNGAEVDIWSCGVSLYLFVVGNPPFQGKDLLTLYRKVIDCDYVIPSFISPELENLFKSIFVFNPEERATLDSIIDHPWVTEGDNWKCQNFPLSPPKITQDHIDHSILSQLLETYGLTKEIALSSILSNQYDPISATFRLLVDKQRKATEREVHRAMGQIHFNPHHFDRPNFISGFVSSPTSPFSSVPSSPVSSRPTSPRSSCSSVSSDDDEFSSSLKSPISTSPILSHQSGGDEETIDHLSLSNHHHSSSNSNSSNNNYDHYDNINMKEEGEEERSIIVRKKTQRHRQSKERSHDWHSVHLPSKHSSNRLVHSSHHVVTTNNSNNNNNKHLSTNQHGSSDQIIITNTSSSSISPHSSSNNSSKSNNSNNNNNNIGVVMTLNSEKVLKRSNSENVTLPELTDRNNNMMTMNQRKKMPTTKPLFNSLFQNLKRSPKNNVDHHHNQTSSHPRSSTPPPSPQRNPSFEDVISSPPSTPPHSSPSSPYVLSDFEAEAFLASESKSQSSPPSSSSSSPATHDDTSSSSSHINNDNVSSITSSSSSSSSQTPSLRNTFSSILSWTKELINRKKNEEVTPRQVNTIMKDTLSSHLPLDEILKRIYSCLNDMHLSFYECSPYCLTVSSEISSSPSPSSSSSSLTSSSSSSSSSLLTSTSVVTFEIEVCALPRIQQFYVIRFRRVNGKWEDYKEICSLLEQNLLL